MALTEVSIGGAYDFQNGFKFGLAWRGGFLDANLSSVAQTSGVTLNMESRDLKGSNMFGFRMGGQYDADQWGIGFMYRNAMNYTANGRIEGYCDHALCSGGVVGGELSAKTQFPQALSIGAHANMGEYWMSHYDYTWTQYSAVDRIDFEGNYRIPAALGGTLSVPDDMLHWLDQHNLRLGFEYVKYKMPIRFGYTWTSQVTAEHEASPTLAPPGMGHTLSLGTGRDWESLSLNGAVDYSSTTGKVSAGKRYSLEGDYKLTVWSAHLGATYAF